MIVRRRRRWLPAAEPTEEELKARAERNARLKEERKRDAPVAMAEYRAAEQATRLKTERLRAERFAREAEQDEQTSRTRVQGLSPTNPAEARR